MAKGHRLIGIVTALLLLVLGSSLTAAQGPAPLAPLGTAFTYQGQLQDGAGPVDNVCDFEFRLYDAASSGAQIGTTQTKLNVPVSAGFFTVSDLDFGAGAFGGEARWLEIAVRCPAGSGSYNTLVPRQALTAAPYATYADTSPWGGLAGVPAGFADDVDDDVLGGIVCANGQVAKWNGSSWACADDEAAVVVTGTNIVAGEGLTAFASGNSITLSVAVPYRLPQGCADGQLPLWDGSVWACGALGSHDHWGQTWSGSGTGLTLQGGSIGLAGSGTSRGLYGESVDGTGVYGIATGTGSANYGVWARTDSTAGRALYAVATAASGEVYAVSGEVHSPDGAAVYALNGSASGVAYAVYGETMSNGGYGVSGVARSSTGFTRGLEGQAYSTDGIGVYGWARATSGVAHGVMGYSSSKDGAGVYGRADAGSGNTSGVAGTSTSTAGTGVLAIATATSGATLGVWGQVNSPQGWAVYGESFATTGQTVGVYGQTISPDGFGVVGRANANSGATHGVYGVAASTRGVGLYGTAPITGVYGIAMSTTSFGYGVFGEAAGPGGRGVEGVATHTASGNYGVLGMAYGTAGAGVSGVAMATQGENAGVKGGTYSWEGSGVHGISYSEGAGVGVWGEASGTNSTGVVGGVDSTTGYTQGVVGSVNSVSANATGVSGYSWGTTGASFGVRGVTISSQGVGVQGENGSTAGGHGVKAVSAGGAAAGAALYAEAQNTTNGIAIHGHNSSGDATMLLENFGAGDLIKAFISGGQLRFRVTNAGDVLSDAGFHTPAADMAEMLPAAAGLEPGDVLCVGREGALVLCTEAYQGSVVGVYSTRPGFVGGSGVDGDTGDKVPLAVVGVVPVKASAENGPIVPGDLLAAGGTAGHAMRCVGVDACFGRTIGKALEGLDAGSGTILMLVVLQ